METIDVLIVGAGPVGMTLGIALSLLSLQIRVVDKAPATKREPRAAVIWQRTQGALAALGIINKLEKEAYQFHSLDLYGDGSHLGTLELGHLKSEYPFPLIVEQHVTERLLAERLAELGIRIEWEREGNRLFAFTTDSAPSRKTPPSLEEMRVS